MDKPLPLSRSEWVQIDKAIEFIEQNARYSISAIHLSIDVELDLRKLQAGIKKRTSFTIHQYHMEVRIRKSKHDLVDTDLPVRLIASRNGFKNGSQFGKLFKKKTGVTPFRFRQMSLMKEYEGESSGNGVGYL